MPAFSKAKKEKKSFRFGRKKAEEEIDEAEEEVEEEAAPVEKKVARKKKLKKTVSKPSMPKTERPKMPAIPKKEVAPREKAEPKVKVPVDRRKFLPKSFPEELELAPLWKRLVAYLLDFFICGIVWFILFLVMMIAIGDMIVLIPALVLLALIPLGYFLLFEANTGQTFFKKKFGIKTVNHRGDTPSPDQIKKSSMAKAVIGWNLVDFLGLLQTKSKTMQRSSQHTQKFGLFVVCVPEETVEYEDDYMHGDEHAEYSDDGPHEYDDEPEPEPKPKKKKKRPKAGKPKVEESKVEEPKAEEKPEEPKAEEPKVEEPKPEETASGEAAADSVTSEAGDAPSEETISS